MALLIEFTSAQDGIYYNRVSNVSKDNLDGFNLEENTFYYGYPKFKVDSEENLKTQRIIKRQGVSQQGLSFPSSFNLADSTTLPGSNCYITGFPRYSM